MLINIKEGRCDVSSLFFVDRFLKLKMSGFNTMRSLWINIGNRFALKKESRLKYMEWMQW
jgi:hypothetical protein